MNLSYRSIRTRFFWRSMSLLRLAGSHAINGKRARQDSAREWRTMGHGNPGRQSTVSAFDRTAKHGRRLPGEGVREKKVSPQPSGWWITQLHLLFPSNCKNRKNETRWRRGVTKHLQKSITRTCRPRPEGLATSLISSHNRYKDGWIQGDSLSPKRAGAVAG